MSTHTDHAPGGDTPTEHVDLVVDGMTCASCAARVEKRLNGLDGVAATVNFATEKASVDFDPAAHDVDDLCAAVGDIGYSARPKPDPHSRSVLRGGTDPSPLAEQNGHAGSEHGGHGGHDAMDHMHHDLPADVLRRRAIVAVVLGLPVLLLSMVPGLQFRGWQWVAFALATPVAIWCAWPFHSATVRNLRHGATTMDTLVSMGVIAAYGLSAWNLLFGEAGTLGMEMRLSLRTSRGAFAEHLYLEVAAATTAFLLLGRFLEARAKRRAGAAIESLLVLGAREASVLDADGRERTVPIDELEVGDRFVVRPGEKVATDGVVVEGRSAVDRSIVTGESVPEEVEPGDEVIGATINAGGRLVVEATRVGADTALAQIARLVEQAQSGKAAVQRLADRISAVFVPVVLVLAAATLAGWLLSGADASFAVGTAVAVLIVACPCALGLATPTALLVGTGRGAQLGILIKGPEVLEAVRRIDTVVLDKTGTVTTGDMALLDAELAPGIDDAVAWRRIGAVEHAAEHPLARAVVAAAVERVGDLPPVEGFEATAGLGVVGLVEGTEVVVGRPELLGDRGFADPHGLAGDAGRAASVVVAGWDGEVRARLLVADQPKPTSAEAVAGLRAAGLRPMLLTGDRRSAAIEVAAHVGIDADDVVAEVLPAGKVEVIERLQRDGRVVAMVGDGVNDAAALAQADLGLAMGAGADVAVEASDLTIVGGDLRSVAVAIRLARRTLGTIRANLFWAFAYNVAAIPLAAAGFLNPVIAGLAMAASSVLVVANSLRLRRA
jgi:Cu+-exporting ATPase